MTCQCGQASLWRWRPWWRPSQGEAFRCEGIWSKEDLHYCIRQSARNLLEQNQVQRASWKSSRSCYRKSNNQPRFTSLEIPWGFLAWAVLCRLTEAHVTWESTSLRILCKKEIYDTQLPNRRSHQKSSTKSGNRKQTRYWVHYQGPINVLLWGNSAICARIMGVHVWRTTLECPRFEKMVSWAESMVLRMCVRWTRYVSSIVCVRW